MQVFAKDKVIFSFNQNNKPAYFVDDGEIFMVETDDCYSGQIKNESIKRPDIDISIMDCSVGPIYVNGAEPDDVLCVEILKIDFAPQGVMVTSKGLGVLGEKITEPNTKIIPISGGYAHFAPGIDLPLTKIVEQQMDWINEHGLINEDQAAMVKYYEDSMGVVIG